MDVVRSEKPPPKLHEIAGCKHAIALVQEASEISGEDQDCLRSTQAKTSIASVCDEVIAGYAKSRLDRGPHVASGFAISSKYGEIGNPRHSSSHP